MTKYELLQSISQRENGTLSQENAELALIANDIIRATTSSRDNESESRNSSIDAIRLNDIEGGRPSTQNEIDCYMAALGFDKISVGRFKNEYLELFDLLPKNALKDITGALVS